MKAECLIINYKYMSTRSLAAALCGLIMKRLSWIRDPSGLEIGVGKNNNDSIKIESLRHLVLMLSVV